MPRLGADIVVHVGGGSSRNRPPTSAIGSSSPRSAIEGGRVRQWFPSDATPAAEIAAPYMARVAGAGLPRHDDRACRRPGNPASHSLHHAGQEAQSRTENSTQFRQLLARRSTLRMTCPIRCTPLCVQVACFWCKSVNAAAVREVRMAYRTPCGQRSPSTLTCEPLRPSLGAPVNAVRRSPGTAPAPVGRSWRARH